MRVFSIILADDEQQILYGMKKGIEWEKLGFRVAGVAQNGKEALELMEEVHPDLVISDIKMPFMDGLELAKHIHEDYMNTKVILFSGWDDFEYARLAISYGVSEYIMKPINYEEMQNLLMKMHEELDKEYNEKMTTAGQKLYEGRLENSKKWLQMQKKYGAISEQEYQAGLNRVKNYTQKYYGSSNGLWSKWPRRSKTRRYRHSRRSKRRASI